MSVGELEAHANRSASIQRRLVAIVFADIVGFSALIEHDDAGTFGRIRLLRTALVVPEVENFGGKVVHTAGDSFLLAFGSIMDAVYCAARLQQLISRFDGDHPPDRRLRLRIGVTIGDVLSDGTDIHGSDVNIAARLQAACPSGAICVSRAIYERVKGRLNATVDELGEIRLKNIAQPVEAFVLHVCPDAELPDRANGDPLQLHVPGVQAGPFRIRPERCQITVLSAEMVRITDDPHDGDPEDIRLAVETFRRLVAEIVSQYGGSLSQASAREMQAHFGFPVAQEDAAERAVHCALMLADQRVAAASDADARFRLRIGIATGQVVAEPRGELVGDAPGEAARLRTFSGQGGVVTDAATVRMTGRLFEYRALEGTSPAGTTGSPSIWEVLGSSVDVSRFEARHRGKLLPLFGREEELSLLFRRWQKARQCEGEAVLLSGEPGIGKSRLARALADGIARQPHRKLEYCCSARYRNIALHPVIVQIRNAAAIAADDDDGTKFAKLERYLQPLTVSSESLPLTADLLGIHQHAISGQEVGPHRKKDRTLDVLLEQFTAHAARYPILLVAEDLQWMDPTSTELLARLVPRIDRMPALLVMTARPGFVPPWPEYAHTKILPLTRLSRCEGMALAAELARGRPLPAESLNGLIARSEGIPLFVEELTKNLLEERMRQDHEGGPQAGAPSSRPVLPPTLQVSLMARLDRFVLAKQIAQVGAVIGREFSYDLLAAVEDMPEDKLRSGLRQLVRSELVFHQGSPPDSVYTFKHALVQEAAYDSLLRSDRKRLHGLIASALQDRQGETAGSHPELLAYHCAEAGLAKEAAAHWLEAGQLSMHLCMMAEAEIQLHRGVDLLEGAPDERETTALELRLQLALTRTRILTRGFASPETAAAAARAKHLWERLGSPPGLAGPVIYGQWFISIVRADLDVAAATAAQLMTFADVQDNVCLRAMAVYYHAITLNLRGQFSEALEALSSALAMQDPACESIYAAFQAHHPRPSILMQLSRTLAYMGFPEQARAASQTALEQARASENPQTLAYMLTLGFLSEWAFRRPTELLRQARELMTVAEEHRFPQYLTAGRAAYGWCLVKSGEMQKGLDLLAGSFGNTQTGTRLYEPFRLALVADAWGAAGQPQTGLNSLDEAFEMMEVTDERWAEAELHRIRGELLVAVGDTRAAARSFGTALRVAEGQKAKTWELRAAASLARLWRQEGRHADAQALVRPVVDWFTEGRDTALLAEVSPLL